MKSRQQIAKAGIVRSDVDRISSDNDYVRSLSLNHLEQFHFAPAKTIGVDVREVSDFYWRGDGSRDVVMSDFDPVRLDPRSVNRESRYQKSDDAKKQPPFPSPNPG
jgi:hypothetical protein